MSRFDFITPHVVDLAKIEDLGEREFYLDRTIAQSTINIVYAPAGTGKTWLSFALSGALMDKGKEVIYLDNDNGVYLIKDRGWDRFLERYRQKMHYVNADMLDDAESDMKKIMHDMMTRAEDGFYENVVVFYDSLQFFLNGGMYDESKIKKFNTMCKKIRKAGGTVIILNHSTKNGLTMKGGGTLIDSADEVWSVKSVYKDESEKHFVMTPEKQRNGTEEVGYALNTTTMKMTKIDTKLLNMTEMEKEFIYAVKSELSKIDDTVSQSDLLKLIGRAPTDKYGNEMLKKYDGEFWVTHREGKKKMYRKIDEE